MASASAGRKMWCIMSSCHSPVSAFMRVQTRESAGIVCGGEMTRNVVCCGSHLSSQIWTEEPSPTCHLLPLLMTSWAAMMLRHAKEGFEPNSACRKSQWVKVASFEDMVY